MSNPQWFNWQVGSRAGAAWLSTPAKQRPLHVSQVSNLNLEHCDIPKHVQKTKGKSVALWLPIAIKINCHMKLLIPTKRSYTTYQLKDRANSPVV